MVGAVGFEPTTPWSQTRCTTRLCYAPMFNSKSWGEWWDSNPRQPESQSGALPTELHPPLPWFLNIKPPKMARLTGFEPVTIRLEGGCSIQLSYKRFTDDFHHPPWRIGRSSRIRTYDPLVPNQVHYQAVLCSDVQLKELGWMMGFEPTTTGITIRGSTNWATSTIALVLKYQATKNGAPDRIRTCDHPLRRRMLYPTELQALYWWFSPSALKNWSEQ